ncbi:MAG: HDOD domain-containing protein [Pyrinomonadaceae bacterium]|nr:HDOD domain-containing protein [Pyrinomonadaceae bacterium]
MNLQTDHFQENAAPPAVHIDVEALVRTKLPPLPGSVVRILQLLQDSNVTTRALADAVSFDPLLTTRILRLANSPIYSLQRRVMSIATAIDVIGMRSLYDILMLSAAAESFSAEIRTSVIGRLIWEHSLTTALYARELSRELGLRGTEEVFLCGLLHDIGKILLLRADPQEYADALEKRGEKEMLVWEQETFGIDHSSIGELVAKSWKLPEAVGFTIANHHRTGEIENIVPHLISVSDTVANINGFGVRFEEIESLTNSESVQLLQLKGEVLESVWERIEPGLQEVMDSFG